MRSGYAGAGRSTSGSGCRQRSAIALAARALIAEWGDEGKALVRLGFPAMNKLPANQVPIYRDHIARVFDSPGVRAILKRDLARVDADQEAIISRLHRSAIYGDDATSVRAAALLIKVCGWECQRRWQPRCTQAKQRGDTAAPKVLGASWLGLRWPLCGRRLRPCSTEARLIAPSCEAEMPNAERNLNQ